MIRTAIHRLNNADGSSIQAIKKYIRTNYPRTNLPFDNKLFKKTLTECIDGETITPVPGHPKLYTFR
jgi:hypothetical protein